MPLPAPNLDDRRFQDLVDDAKRLVQQRCPEWSDHNVSDPGITLIETFAFMVDQLFYRLNRVPDLHYVKFLEMIGVRQFPPVAARGKVTFWLSAPMPSPVIVNRGTEVATVRTEVEESVVFRVDDDLEIVPCELLYLRSQTAERAQGSRTAAMVDHHEAVMRPRRGPDAAPAAGRASSLASFAAIPAPGDVLYVGLSDPVPKCAVALRFECHIEGIGVDPTRPPLGWEAFDGRAWAPCEVDRDSTGGLNRDGDVVLHVPPTHAASVIDGERAGWLRAVVLAAAEGQPAYSTSPQIESARAFTIGGTTPVVNAEPVEREVLGVSGGVPGQRFMFQHGPVLPGEAGSTVLETAAGQGWEQWTEVDDFADSGPGDLHVVIDRRSGEVQFGPQVRQPDGSLAQYGAVPAKGATVRVPAYIIGGGSRGNVGKGAISVLRSTIPFVSRIENRASAAGGVDGETLEETKIRGPLVLRTRNRAVTAEDYEHLAREAAPEVARVRCLPAGSGADAGDRVGVRVLVVPAAESDDMGRLRFEQLIPPAGVLERVAAYLDERRTLGARVSVEPPHYQGLTAVVRIRARRRANPQDLEREGRRALYRFFHPLVGGPERTGWAFGRPVRVGELYAVLQDVAGVDYLEDARIFPADPVTGERGDAVNEILIAANSLVFSYEHAVRVTV